MKRKKGSAIAYGLIIVAAVTVILTGVMQFIVSQIKYASYIEIKEKTFHVAESGIYFYRWYLAHSVEGKTQQEIIDFWNGSPLGLSTPYIKDYLDNSGNKIGEAEISVDITGAGGTINVIEVTSIGRTISHPEITRTIKSTLRRSIWSDFAVLSDSPVCFDVHWTINGMVMANEGVHFDGVANNKVLAGVSSYDDTNPLHDEYLDVEGVWTTNADPGAVFKAGTKYPVPKKDFNGVTSDLEAIKEAAMEPGGATVNGCTATGCYYDGSGEGRRIILKNDDSFDICTVDQYWTNGGTNHHYPRRYKKVSGGGTCSTCSGDCLQNFDTPDSGVIFVDNHVWIEGTVNGNRLTIAAASMSNPTDNARIHIGINNIKYTNYNGDDVIGMIAEGNVEVLKNSGDDLEIDGVLLAQYGQVQKAEYNPVCCGVGCELGKNNLDVYGAVITRYGLEIGYHKDCPNINVARTITYDNNLYLYPPPFFPADSFYYIDKWEEL